MIKWKLSRHYLVKKKHWLLLKKEMKESAKVLGLEAGLILEFDVGDTKYHIEYWKQNKIIVAIITFKDTTSKDASMLGSSLAKKCHSSVMQLWVSFGYRSFDYTREKSTKVIEPNTCVGSKDLIFREDSIFFGNYDTNSGTSRQFTNVQGMYS